LSGFTMTIGGAAAGTAAAVDVIKPPTGRPHAAAPDCTREQLDAAFGAAAEAYPEWRADEAGRRKALKVAADALMAASGGDLAQTLTAEQGKPLQDATFEIIGAAIWLRHFADLEIPREIIQDDDKARVEVVRRPLGVVAAITPWNFPLVLAAWKIAPALLAGNTMVLKPSPYTPLATLKVGELLREVLPPGVFNVVSGGDDLGAWMTSHPVPRKISFTGSITTGKKVAAAAAPDLKRVTLELGGNDPAIVLDDADPAVVADKVFAQAFANNGQVCSAIKRVYVPERLYDDVVEALADKARSVKVGNGLEEGVEYGPINNRPQYERVSELVADALSNGARAAAGGRPMDGPGYFFEPTILADLSEGVRIVDEEQFGPALPVLRYTDVDDAIARANATHFGLSGSVWGTDTDRAAEVAERLECGTVWVNTHLALAPHQPFGGFKWSGLGVENGTWGLVGFTDIQVVHRAKPSFISSPNMTTVPELLLPFLGVVAVLTVTPGPDMLLVVRNGLSAGSRVAWLTGLGCCLGISVHATAAVLGLSAILRASATAYAALKLAGAAYLAYLGVRMLISAIMSGDEASDEADAAAPSEPSATARTAGAAAFRQGLVTNILNPKIALLFLTLLPQFVAAGEPRMPTTATLAAVFLGIAVLWWRTFSLAIGPISRVLHGTGSRRLLDGVAGSALLAISARVAFDSDR
jgi:acyl-CoA reductase-like NAD-dependent aldehyde dehydrogenase/threonine/homoserine/homoserine lactone efflux protein